MTKKIFALLIAILSVVMAFAQADSRWSAVPSTDKNVKNVIETPDKTYFQMGPSLFSLSNDGKESYSYSKHNKLTESADITGIWYNSADKYLVVAYANGGIDLLYDNGRTVALPDIKDAVLATAHTINSVAFADGKIYVGTVFGLVIFDEARHIVLETAMLGKSVSYVGTYLGKLLIIVDYNSYMAPLDGRHTQLSDFSTTGAIYAKSIGRLSDNSMAVVHTNGTPYIFRWNGTKWSPTAQSITSPIGVGTLKDGAYIYTASKIYAFDQSGKMTEYAIPAAYTSAVPFSTTDMSSIWFNNKGALSKFDMTAATPTVLVDGFEFKGLPMKAFPKITASVDGQYIYPFSFTTSFVFKPYENTNEYNHEPQIGQIHNGEYRNMVPKVADKTQFSSLFPTWQNNTKTTSLAGGCTDVAVNPNDPEMVFFSSRLLGVTALKNGQVLANFGNHNTPFGNYTNVMTVAFDMAGNLWAGVGYKANGPFFVLPAAKVQNLSSVVSSDWTPVNFNGYDRNGPDEHLLFSRDKRTGLILGGSWGTTLVFFDNNGTPLNFKDDKVKMFNELHDQHGNSVNLTFVLTACEDADGRMWIGTNQGLFYLPSMAAGLADQPQVIRPVVPRNDGTNQGDYLLSVEVIHCIATDAANRKWIATANSGLYLVNSEGTEIIANYTTQNSPLPSECVYSVYCDPQSNKVYIGTQNGMVTFDSDASPASPDFNNVYAYPNPVRPDYTGLITVAGLMNDSLVKIADASGNVVFQGQSEGGMITWDGCDASGSRVKSGVYFVFASSNEGGSSDGVVTKIMVIN